MRDKRVLPVLIVFLFLFVGCFMFAHGFLCMNAPVDGEVLGVEGWISDTAMRHAIRLFREGRYRRLVVVDVTPSERDDSSALSHQSASTLDRLRRLGADVSQVSVVLAPLAPGSRTVLRATALQQWMSSAMPDASSVDIVTETVHARKSYTLFRKVYPKHVRVGIIAAQTSKYDVDRWYLSATGIRLVFRNILGYLYALWLNPR